MSKHKSPKKPMPANKKPESKSKRERVKTAVEIAAAVATALSLPIVIFTLIEMKTQRDKAYEPAIVFERKAIEFSHSGSHLSVHPTINVLNAGVGSARNIMITVDYEMALEPWIKKLDKFTDLKPDESDDTRLWLISNDDDIPFRSDFFWAQSYLLPNGEQKELFELPLGITAVLHEYAKQGKEVVGETGEKTRIPMSIHYEDIQGKLFEKVEYLYVKIGKSGKDATTLLLQSEPFFDEGVRFVSPNGQSYP